MIFVYIIVTCDTPLKLSQCTGNKCGMTADMWSVHLSYFNILFAFVALNERNLLYGPERCVLDL